MDGWRWWWWRGGGVCGDGDGGWGRVCLRQICIYIYIYICVYVYARFPHVGAQRGPLEIISEGTPEGGGSDTLGPNAGPRKLFPGAPWGGGLELLACFPGPMGVERFVPLGEPVGIMSAKMEMSARRARYVLHPHTSSSLCTCIDSILCPCNCMQRSGTDVIYLDWSRTTELHALAARDMGSDMGKSTARPQTYIGFKSSPKEAMMGWIRLPSNLNQFCKWLCVFLALAP